MNILLPPSGHVFAVPDYLSISAVTQTFLVFMVPQIFIIKV